MEQPIVTSFSLSGGPVFTPTRYFPSPLISAGKLGVETFHQKSNS